MDQSNYVPPTNQAKYARAAAHPEAAQRIARRTRSADNGCVEWTGATRPKGYGALRVAGQDVIAHRLSYWVHRGPIEPGMVVDHLCHNRACVNPDHLEVVTMQVNSSRSLPAAKTHCELGHPLSGDNLSVRFDAKNRPHRNCITCNRRRSAEWRRLNK